MRIYEVIGVKLGAYQVYAARNEEEVTTLALMVQEQGGIPVVREAEVPEGFDEFALDLPGAIPEPSLN
jgi:hypothetical protein